MANVFNRLRQNFLKQSQCKKYFANAMGQIILIVLEILIAVYLNNKSEAIKQESQFKLSLQQLYNSMKTDSEFLHSIGNTIYYGANIKVEKGEYSIELNLTDNTYTFKKRS